mmetsp:Transcript_29993/g.48864  ORF Transcript_29993/g.48864 Transcript_29993/m.48864 type:complete len:207 (-) Transcript_29993:303-923(-)
MQPQNDTIAPWDLYYRRSRDFFEWYARDSLSNSIDDAQQETVRGKRKNRLETRIVERTTLKKRDAFRNSSEESHIESTPELKVQDHVDCNCQQTGRTVSMTAIKKRKLSYDDDHDTIKCKKQKCETAPSISCTPSISMSTEEDAGGEEEEEEKEVSQQAAAIDEVVQDHCKQAMVITEEKTLTFDSHRMNDMPACQTDPKRSSSWS